MSLEYIAPTKRRSMTKARATRLMVVKDMTRFMDLVFRRHSGFGVVLTVPPDKYAYDP